MSIHIAQPGEDGAGGEEVQLPEALPVQPLRDSVPFPDTITPLAIGQERSVKLVNDVLAGNRMLAMVASKDAEVENPGQDQVYRVGVAGVVARMLKVPDGSLRIGKRQMDQPVAAEDQIGPGQVGARHVSAQEAPTG